MQVSTEKIGDYLLKGGLLLVALSLVILFLIFYPVIRSEVKFMFSDKGEETKIALKNEVVETGEKSDNVIVPIDENFNLIIPKIGANEKIIAEVNPFNQGEYQPALKEGIAHAKGSSLPGKEGNVFLFAHSSGNFYQNSRLNTIFFLLNKLEKGDQLSIIYKEEIYQYEVFDKKIVAENEVEYMDNNKKEKVVTLMTCWPPGTSYKRLLVLGKLLD